MSIGLDEFTIAMWLKTLNTSTANNSSKPALSLFECVTSSGDARISALLDNNAANATVWRPVFKLADSGAPLVPSNANSSNSSSVTLNTWTHVAFALRAASSQAAIYLNGQLIAQATLSAPLSNHTSDSQQPLVCSFGPQPQQQSLPASMAIDELTVARVALSPRQLRALMSVYAPASVARSLAALGARHLWTFNAGSLRDSLDQQLLRVNGNVSFVADRYGVAQSAVALTGSGGASWLQTPTGEFDVWPSGGGELTIAAWLYVTSMTGAESRLLDCGTGTPGEANVVLALQRALSRQPYFAVWNGGVSKSLSLGKAWPLNGWSHLAITLTSTANNGTTTTTTTTATIYSNSVLKATSGDMHTPLALSDASVRARTSCLIGKSNWAADGPTDAYIDDLVVMDTALNTQQIIILMNTNA